MTHAPSPASPRWHWLLLLLLPALVTMAVPDWLYSVTSAIDAWVYHGFFRHLETYTETMFPSTYYGTRLGWIVPGYVAYHVFEPHVARVVLHLTFYVTALVSLYVIVRRLGGASSALFTASMFGLYLPTIQSLGWDYVDGAVITYLLMTIALLLGGLEDARPWLTFASGMAAGAMLHSNIGAAFLFPSVLVWFVPPRLNGIQWKPLIMHGGLWSAGIVACTGLLGAVSVKAGGEFAFFMPSFRWMARQGWSNPWDVAGITWVARSPWLFLPAAVLIASLVIWLFLGQDRRLSGGAVKAVIALATTVVIFGLWDFVGIGALLALPYYTSWLLPSTFIVIGAMLAPAAERARSDLLILFLGVAAMVASMMWQSGSPLPLGGFAGFAVTIGVTVFAAVVRPVVVRRLAFVVALVCLHGWLRATPEYGPSPDKVDGFRVIDRGIGVIDRYLTEEQPRFLLAPPQKLGHYVQGLTSVYLWGYSIATDRFPLIAPEQAKKIVPGTRVVVFSEQENAAAPFDDVFAPYGVRGRVMGSERLMTEHGPLYLTFLESIERPSADGSPHLER